MYSRTDFESMSSLTLVQNITWARGQINYEGLDSWLKPGKHFALVSRIKQ